MRCWYRGVGGDANQHFSSGDRRRRAARAGGACLRAMAKQSNLRSQKRNANASAQAAEARYRCLGRGGRDAFEPSGRLPERRLPGHQQPGQFGRRPWRLLTRWMAPRQTPILFTLGKRFPSWPALCRPSTPGRVAQFKSIAPSGSERRVEVLTSTRRLTTWIPGTRPGMTRG